MTPFTRLALLAIIVSLSGCSTLGYYGQAVRGQLEILDRREDVGDLLARPDLEEELRARLQTADAIRTFAVESLALPDNKSYRSYAELGRRYVVWNVLAAPADSIELRSWCFPVAGCVAYKGFFSEQDALELAEELAAEGHDTWHYGVTAYSTLGWFADPLLDTFIHAPDEYLAGLVFHELAHQVAYARDDSAFNEAYATAVERAGVALWLDQHGDAAAREAYRARKVRDDHLTRMVLDYRQRLASVYGDPDSDRDTRLARKAALIAQMKEDYAGISARGEGTPYYDWWFSLPLNNAHLAAVATYHQLVPAFENALAQAGSFAAFHQEVKTIAEASAGDRQAWLSRLDPDQ